MRYTLSVILSCLFVVSCGGGGGGGSSDSPSGGGTSSPSISINLSSNVSQANTGDEIQLTWSSSNATSCSASGFWSGSKGVSGTETLILKNSGSLTFSLSCSSSGSSSSSKSVSVNATPVLNAYAYIDEPTTFQGFYVYKKRDVAIRVKSITVDFDINDKDSLFITRFRFNEDRYLAGFNNSDGNPDGLGLRLGNNRSVDEAGEQTTYYIPQVSETFHSTNQLLFNTSSINPYTYVDEVAQTFDDLELFNATLTLDFDSDYADPNGHGNIRMSLWATPKTAEDSYDAAFIGASNSNDSYAFLYLVDKRVWDANTNNLASESDIFNQNLYMVDIFTSYRSQPNIEPFLDYGLVTRTDFAQLNNTTQFLRDTTNGARLADAIDLTTNAVIDPNTYAIKYLQPESTSLQRIFLKSSLVSDSLFTNDCLASYNPYRGCDLVNWQMYFLAPDKEGFIGLHMGGYFGAAEQTNARVLIEN